MPNNKPKRVKAAENPSGRSRRNDWRRNSKPQALSARADRTQLTHRVAADEFAPRPEIS